jgi:hypothetical protein
MYFIPVIICLYFIGAQNEILSQISKTSSFVERLSPVFKPDIQEKKVWYWVFKLFSLASQIAIVVSGAMHFQISSFGLLLPYFLLAGILPIIVNLIFGGGFRIALAGLFIIPIALYFQFRLF